MKQSSLRLLAAPDATTQAVSFHSELGLEKRELSTHCAEVYRALQPVISGLPLLLSPSLLPFLREPLEQGFGAIWGLESQVYRRWCQDAATRQVSVMGLCDG